MAAFPENLVVIENTGIGRLFDRLQKGMRIKSRIVFVLDKKRYLLRIHGYNLIMESKLNFNRLEEIWIEVQAVRPKLKLRLLKSEHEKTALGGTDIII